MSSIYRYSCVDPLSSTISTDPTEVFKKTLESITLSKLQRNQINLFFPKNVSQEDILDIILAYTKDFCFVYVIEEFLKRSPEFQLPFHLVIPILKRIFITESKNHDLNEITSSFVRILKSITSPQNIIDNTQEDDNKDFTFCLLEALLRTCSQTSFLNDDRKTLIFKKKLSSICASQTSFANQISQLYAQSSYIMFSLTEKALVSCLDVICSQKNLWFDFFQTTFPFLKKNPEFIKLITHEIIYEGSFSASLSYERLEMTFERLFQIPLTAQKCLEILLEEKKQKSRLQNNHLNQLIHYLLEKHPSIEPCNNLQTDFFLYQLETTIWQEHALLPPLEIPVLCSLIEKLLEEDRLPLLSFESLLNKIKDFLKEIPLPKRLQQLLFLKNLLKTDPSEISSVDFFIHLSESFIYDLTPSDLYLSLHFLGSKINSLKPYISRLITNLKTAYQSQSFNTQVSQIIFLENLTCIRFSSPPRTQEIQYFLNIIPDHIPVTKIIDVIIKRGLQTLVFLDILEKHYPRFASSAYDKIRYHLLLDTTFKQTTQQLIQDLDQHGLATEENLKELHSLGFQMKHPLIVPLSSVHIPQNKVCFNFVWLYLEPQNRSQDISETILGNGNNIWENAPELFDRNWLESQELALHPAQEFVHIKNTFSYKISKWCSLHPESSFYIWYDSAFVTERAQRQTLSTLNKIALAYATSIHLQDLRKLPLFSGSETRYYFHPGIPLYFRIDALKALIIDSHGSDLMNSRYDYCITSDIDITPMNSAYLFDKSTLSYLDTKGIVFNNPTSHCFPLFENSFSIAYLKHQEFLSVHKSQILEKASKMMNDLRALRLQTIIPETGCFQSQTIFNLYITYWGNLHLKGISLGLKTMECPVSQFDNARFLRTDHQTETFRFIGSSHIPYTRGGRNQSDKEAPITYLKDWKAEPLE